MSRLGLRDFIPLLRWRKASDVFEGLGDMPVRRLTRAEAKLKARGGWEDLMAGAHDGDELWEFRSPAWTWRKLMGRAGLVRVRDGRVAESLLTMMN